MLVFFANFKLFNSFLMWYKYKPKAPSSSCKISWNQLTLWRSTIATWVQL